MPEATFFLSIRPTGRDVDFQDDPNLLEAFDALPLAAQRQAIRAYNLWRADPFHKSLHFKCVSETHGVWSVRVGIHWRALGTREGDEVVWFWIGSHADYDGLIA